MKFQRKRDDIEVFFDNNTKVGTIKWDGVWRQWRISFESSVRLSHHYVKDIYKYLKRLK